MKVSASVLLGLSVALAMPVHAQNDNDNWNRSQIRHVLLISIDGMHAVDFLNCSTGIAGVNDGQPYCPNLASLGVTGVHYVAASTSKPSDSFPGLMNLVTGATPRTMGVYYDVSYDRTLSPPSVTTGNGNAAGACTPGVITGYSTEFDEGIDIDQTKLNGGAPNAGLTDGGIASIDVSRLDRDPSHGCAPVYPWNFVRVNTIFGVVHAAGGYTAWSDKHPSYSSVAGPGGGTLDDYYSPEINSSVIALPGVTAPNGTSCTSIPDPGSDLTAWTNSFQNIQCYDTLKVNAIVNEIDGKDHDGHRARTPNVFGMNFQAVSVGQKLIEKSNSLTGGYLDAAGTPTTSLLGEIEFVDDSIGEMVNHLRDHGLLDSTLIIITAKHGQSPIDPNRYQAVPGKNNNGESPATVLDAAGYIPASESPAGALGSTEDDVSLLWLKSASDTLPAVQLIESNASTVGLGQIYYGPTLALNYNAPGLPPSGDPRTPDIIVTPNVGVTYTGSATKLAEHGGFAHDDTNVMLLVSNPGLPSETIYEDVMTAQIAPTILEALGLDPRSLQAVRLEGTRVLPGLPLDQSQNH
jgi:hypothetical protein